MYYHKHILSIQSAVDAFADAFVMSVKTDNTGTSTSTQFTIPTTGGGYSYDVEYDGNFLYGQTGDVTLEFGVSGTYDVKIIGTFPRVYFKTAGDKAKLVDVKQWGNNAWTAMSASFYNCTSLTTITATDEPDLSGVSSLNEMFRNSGLTTLDLSGWDVSTITDLGLMFYNCTSLTTLTLTGWVTTALTSTNSMFSFCLSLTALDVNGFDMTGVTVISGMFRDCNALTTLDLSGWDVSAVSSFSTLFSNSIGLVTIDLTGWTTTALTNTVIMFSGCTSLTTITGLGGFDMNGVTTTDRMFLNCNSLNTDYVSTWDVSTVSDMGQMFQNCSAMTALDVTSWVTSSVIKTDYMFSGCTLLTSSDVSGFDIADLTDATGMFASTSMTTVVYDALLIAWEGQIEKPNVPFNAGSSTYTLGGAAATARAALVSNGWIITDGGGI
jgi:surface protein